MEFIKESRFIDLRNKTAENELLFVAIQRHMEQIPYNFVILNSKFEFVLKKIEEMGYAGVIYTSSCTNEDIWIVFDPDRNVKFVIHDVISPEDYETFFRGYR